MKPLSTLSIYLILCLGSEEHHGYELMQLVTEASAGVVTPGPASLYTTIQHLIEQKLIKASREETVQGRLRRYYRITSAGSEGLRDESTRLETFLQQIKSKLS